jgi:hypothetical protein
MNGQLVDITDSVTRALNYLSWAVLFLCGLMIIGIYYLHSILKRLPGSKHRNQSRAAIHNSRLR